MTAFVYDSGALIAAEDNDRRIWTIHRRALERRAVPIVPAGVLTEAWRVTARRLPGFSQVLRLSRWTRNLRVPPECFCRT
jgi:hypothetical protein